MTHSTTTRALVELMLPAVPASVREARVLAGAATLAVASDEQLADDVRLCVSEAVTNVVHHAYEATIGAVQLVVTREGDELVVVVRDDGTGVGPSRPRSGPGGLGLEIIDRLTSRCVITSAPNAGTTIRMSFALSGRSQA